MKKIYWAVIALVIILPIAWYLLSPLFISIELDEASPLEQPIEQEQAAENREIMEPPKILLEGNFIPSAHEVSGKALVIDTSQGKVLRFEDFETVNGPDLFIYLSSDLDSEDFIDLGRIKATKGNVNYQLPDDVDLERYNKVLVWCRAFRVLFNYAELK